MTTSFMGIVGWTEDKEREYLRKQTFVNNKKCPLCHKALLYGHLIKHGEGYAHRRCVLQHLPTARFTEETKPNRAEGAR